MVVSDYSDDIMGLTLEDIEYIRNRKDHCSSADSSLHSSCSNLNYCGSSISGIDSEYVMFKPYRKSSNCSTCSTLSDDEESPTVENFPDSKLQPQRKEVRISLGFVSYCDVTGVLPWVDWNTDKNKSKVHETE